MRLDLAPETPVTLNEAARLLLVPAGRTTHASTFHRWLHSTVRIHRLLFGQQAAWRGVVNGDIT